MSEVEQLLHTALVPVEPPGALIDRVERGLAGITDAAAEQLADWELAAMRDPRNWARPVAAGVVVGVAGGALVLVRARQRQKSGSRKALQALERGIAVARDDLLRRVRD